MKLTNINKVAFLLALTASSSCASSVMMQEPLNEAEIKKILIQEELKADSRVEQQPQDDGTVSLLVTSNIRATTFAGCLAERADLELMRSAQGWSVSSRSDTSKVALVPCAEARDTGFASIESDFPPKHLDQSVRHLRQLIEGSLSPSLVFGSSELKEVLKSVNLHEVQSIFLHENKDVEFQFVSPALLPRMLGIRLSVEGGRLMRVQLNDDNGIEVVEPN